MKNSNLKICDAIIHPGEHLSLALPLPEIYSCAPLYMPITIVHGKQAGPCLLVTAAMHGNELNGTQIINRLLQSPTLKRMKGTLIAVPVLNVYGLINRSRHLPGGTELDCSFPGSATGTHAARLANLFNQEIFSLADVCIDLQTGFMNYTNLPQLYLDVTDPRAKELGEAFNPPVISNIEHKPGSLQELAKQQGKPFLMYEAGEAMRFDEHAIKFGMKGLMNVMRQLDMLPSSNKQPTPPLKSFYAQENIWVRASTSGISYTQCHLGKHVKKGEMLCKISDPFNATDDINIYSEDEAIIVGKNNLPLVHEGEGLFQLAVFNKMQHAASHFESWQEESSDFLTESAMG